MEAVAEVPEHGHGDQRFNPKYRDVDRVLRIEPGVWRKIVAVTEKRAAQKWRQAGNRYGWVVQQRRTETGWDVYGCVPEVQS